MADGHGRSAAVDVGTNSVRVAVLDAHGTRLVRRMAITRLGAGVDRAGRLDDAAIRRTLDVIAVYRTVWEAHEVDPAAVRIGTTSAIRDARDRDRFLIAVAAATGVTPEVLSGDEEAATAFLGAVHGVEVPAPAALLDIGGGSTELIVGDDHHAVAASWSMQLGCVRATERFLTTDPPSPEQVAAARAEIRVRLDDADRHLAAAGVSVADTGSFIGVAGTHTTLAALHLGLDRYDEHAIHGTRLPADAVTAWARRLAAMPTAERAALGPVQPGREDVLAAGALIADEVATRYHVDEIVVSESDILDGLALTAGRRR